MAAEKTKKIHTGIRMEPVNLGKAKHIAEKDRRNFTTVLEMAIEDYIKNWETTNGAITDDEVKAALEKE